MSERKRMAEARYKWIVVAACFLMIFVGLGFCSSNKSMYLGAITQALGIKRSLFSLNDSCRFIATAVVNLFFGQLIARFGAKKLVGAGFGCLTLSVVTYMLAEQVWQFYIGGFLLGVGMSFCSTTMVSYLVNRWMPEKRGTISGAILCANGIGGAVAAQLVSPMINAPDDPFGYRKAYLLVTVLTVLTGILVTVLIREPGEGSRVAAKKKPRGKQWVGISLSQAVRKPYFYGAALCILLCGMSLQGINGIAATHLYDVGMDRDYVKMVLSVASLLLAGSKFLVGFSYDKLGLRFTVTVCQILGSIAFLCLAFAGNAAWGNTLAMGYGILSSLALPLETVLVPLIAADLFGEKDFSKLLGICVSVNTAGYALGTPVANLFFERFGSYQQILLVFCVMMGLVAVGFQWIVTAANRQRSKVTIDN